MSRSFERFALGPRNGLPTLACTRHTWHLSIRAKNLILLIGLLDKEKLPEIASLTWGKVNRPSIGAQACAPRGTALIVLAGILVLQVKQRHSGRLSIRL